MPVGSGFSEGGGRVKDIIKKLIKETKEALDFRQKMDAENPVNANPMKLHYLDGRLETLEEILKALEK